MITSRKDSARIAWRVGRTDISFVNRLNGGKAWATCTAFWVRSGRQCVYDGMRLLSRNDVFEGTVRLRTAFAEDVRAPVMRWR